MLRGARARPGVNPARWGVSASVWPAPLTRGRASTHGALGCQHAWCQPERAGVSASATGARLVWDSCAGTCGSCARRGSQKKTEPASPSPPSPSPRQHRAPSSPAKVSCRASTVGVAEPADGLAGRRGRSSVQIIHTMGQVQNGRV